MLAICFKVVLLLDRFMLCWGLAVLCLNFNLNIKLAILKKLPAQCLWFLLIQIDALPAIAAGMVWRMALPYTKPQELLVAALGHLSGRGIVGVPLLRQSGVWSNRLALLAEFTTLALTCMSTGDQKIQKYFPTSRHSHIIPGMLYLLVISDRNRWNTCVSIYTHKVHLARPQKYLKISFIIDWRP